MRKLRTQKIAWNELTNFDVLHLFDSGHCIAAVYGVPLALGWAENDDVCSDDWCDYGLVRLRLPWIDAEENCIVIFAACSSATGEPSGGCGHIGLVSVHCRCC